MQKHRTARYLAISLISLSVVVAVIAAAMRETDAETPPPSANLVDVAPGAALPLNPYAVAEARPIAESKPIGEAATTNRIRFGTIASAEQSADDGHSCGPNCTHGVGRSPAALRQAQFAAEASADRYADAGDYPVRQAAAEVPYGTRGTPTPAPPRESIAAINAPPPVAQTPSPYGASAATTGDRYGAAATTASRSPFPSTPLPSNPLPSSVAPAGSPAAGSASAAASSGGAPSTWPSSPLPPPATTSAPPSSPLRATPPTASAAAPSQPAATASSAGAAPRELPSAAAMPSSPMREPIASAIPPAAALSPASPPASASPPRAEPQVAAAPTGPSGVGRPGEKALEGQQVPTLVIEKLVPAEIQVGKPALFEIVVRNTGTATATNVEVHDVVPQGTTLISSNPQAAQGKPGELAWLLGPMAPGDQATLQMELLPQTEGEIGSIATVHFTAAASARTICTKPELVIEVQAPRTVMLGDEMPLKIRVFNPGTGVATGVYLTEVVPPNMEHAAGGELEYEVGDLQPNETRELDLTLRAVKEGSAVNLIHGKGDGRLASETKTPFEVVAPALAVAIDGPKRRFLDRQATYTVSLTNPGTAAAREVELATYLPQGLQFVDADNQGEYDEATHSVRWLLEELPPKQRGSVTITALPVEPGQQILRVESTADRGVTAGKEEAILVEGASSIAFQVVDTADPVEVGGETEYEIIVSNDGSKGAGNVQLRITLAEGMKVLDADGPAKFTSNTRQVQFEGLRELPPKSETTFRVRAQCLAAGDHRCQVELLADDMKAPVTKEEGTRVYADE